MALGIGAALCAWRAAHLHRRTARRYAYLETEEARNQRIVDATVKRRKARQDEENRKAVEAELVALIDEWRLVRGDPFRETDYGTYKLLLGKTSHFIERALGEKARQCFEEKEGENAPTLRHSASLRIQALEYLRDHPEEWQLQLDDQALGALIAERYIFTPQDLIVVAGTPALYEHYTGPLGDSVE